MQTDPLYLRDEGMYSINGYVSDFEFKRQFDLYETKIIAFSNTPSFSERPPNVYACMWLGVCYLTKPDYHTGMISWSRHQFE